MLVVMGPVMQVSVARLFAAAILPGIMLASLYVIYTMIRVMINPKLGPPLSDAELDVPTSYKIREFFLGLLPPSVLILATLGTIITGVATPTEGAALGCLGAVIVAKLNGKLTFELMKEAVFRTAETTSMVMILLAASTFMGVVFSSMGTPTFIANTLLSWDLPSWVFLGGILMVCFILGWPLEWIPIVVVQTCWLSPPVALSAYYIKGIMPEWELLEIYKGMMPFMGLQVLGVAVVYFFPQISLWLPKLMFG
jgi:TRAP-type mannitol/chloroaromatic compound transport system permease large subunit